MRVALHACCGPCALEPLDALAEAHDVVLVFANPNIRPEEEYIRRRDTLLAWAGRTGVEVVEVTAPPDAWERATAAAVEAPDRCRGCYEVRLAATAAAAHGLGCDALATTLTVSPYQDVEAIDGIGERVARDAGIVWLFADHRDRYPAATQRARELGMYRQNYCGCLASKAEAEAQRAARRAQRARRR